jgi:hypothetical protein
MAGALHGGGRAHAVAPVVSDPLIRLPGEELGRLGDDESELFHGDAVHHPRAVADAVHPLRHLDVVDSVPRRQGEGVVPAEGVAVGAPRRSADDIVGSRLVAMRVEPPEVPNAVLAAAAVEAEVLRDDERIAVAVPGTLGCEAAGRCPRAVLDDAPRADVAGEEFLGLELRRRAGEIGRRRSAAGGEGDENRERPQVVAQGGLLVYLRDSFPISRVGRRGRDRRPNGRGAKAAAPCR